MTAEKNQNGLNNKILQYLPVTIAGILIITLGIVFEQKFIMLLPTIVSLVVGVLVSRVNRYMFLLSGANCVLYSVGYYMNGLYGTALSAIAISFPSSIMSFILWSKNQTKTKEVIVRRFNKKSGSVFAIAVTLFWIASYFVYKALDTKTLVFETTVFVLGITITFMQMLRFVETPFFNVASSVISTVQWFIITMENVSNINYLIYNIYFLYCVTVSVFKWVRLYKEQNKETEDEITE